MIRGKQGISTPLDTYEDQAQWPPLFNFALANNIEGIVAAENKINAYLFFQNFFWGFWVQRNIDLH